MDGRSVAVAAGVAVAVSGLVAVAAASSEAVGGGSGPTVTQADPEVWAAELGAGRVRAQAKSSTSLTGRVLNPASAGVVGYRVEAFDSDGNFMADALTGPRGVYSMANMQLGPYRLKVSPVRVRTAPWAPVWSGGAVVFTQARVVTLSRAPARVDFRLRPSASITGTVTRGRLPAAKVTIRRCGGSFLDCAQTTTDAKGRYSFTGVPAHPQSFTMFDQRRHSSLPLVARGAVPKIVPGRGIRIDLNVPAVLRGKKVTR